MTDSSLSSDLEQEVSPTRVQKQCLPVSKRVKARVTSKASKAHHSSSRALAQDKADMRRHKALERQFEKAKRRTTQSTNRNDSAAEPGTSDQLDASAGPSLLPCDNACSIAGGPGTVSALGLSKGVSLSLPDVSSAAMVKPSSALRQLPEATFTPTAAGLHTRESGAQLDLHSMLSDALAKILAAGIQQRAGSSQSHTLHPHAQVHDKPTDMGTVSAHVTMYLLRSLSKILLPPQVHLSLTWWTSPALLKGCVFLEPERLVLTSDASLHR